jgi:hypothetical protein
MTSRWSNHCASPCKKPIRKPARRGSLFLATTEQTVSHLQTAAPADDSSINNGVDSIIYYMQQQNRWLMDLVQCDNECDKLSQPMRRLSLAMAQQQQRQQLQQ